LVQVPLVLHQRGAGKVVEIIDTVLGDAGLHRAEQRQVLGDRRRQAGGAQAEDEMREHSASPACQERQALEQVDVLLVLQQRAVQRRNDEVLFVGAQRLGRQV